MESISALAHMGGYGGYVWPAYGISILVLLGVLVASVIGARSAEAELDAIQRVRRANRGTESTE
ncbi:heme exporter protein CcmD [Paramagnetospirillum marisnigri]|nr:heme exporter protein CcmD [Paramagnetospirillum marisnigri]